MTRFRIQTHGRLQEWVAEENGYFAAAVTRPKDLAGVPVAVGYHSGSHFSALAALQQVLDDHAINLVYQGGPHDRLAGLLDGSLGAANLFGIPMYVAEQMGFRKSSTPRS